MILPTGVPVQPAITSETPEVREIARGRGPASVTVIIPAHDEEVTLPICFSSLLKQDYDGVMRVIVVDNGSRDGTVELAGRWARQFAAAGHEMLVLQLKKGNKCAALNAGDAMAVGNCRIYLDADTELSPNCISSAVAALTEGSGIGICSPRLEVARGKSWVTRRYARLWTQLPWVAQDVIGGGFYAVSAEGRQRWGAFPDLLSEDSFAQAQFRLHERRVLPQARFVIRLPEGFVDLVKVRTRWLTGNHQLARQIDGEWGRAAFPLAGRVKALLLRPWLWPDLPLYLLVNLIARWRVRRREALGTSIWERARSRPEIEPLDDDAEAAMWPPP